MVIKYRANLWAGLFGILFGGVLWYLVPRYVGEEYGGGEMIDSRTMPYAIAFVAFACGAGLLFQSLVLKKDSVKEVVLGKEVKALAFMAALALYCYFFRRSFLVSTSLIGIASLAFSGSKKILHYIIVVATVFALYYAFTRFLYVRLP